MNPVLRDFRENKYGDFVILQKSETKLERLNRLLLFIIFRRGILRRFLAKSEGSVYCFRKSLAHRMNTPGILPDVDAMNNNFQLTKSS